MPEFQQQYPELSAPEPLMDGEQPQVPTPLHSMRRQQLHDVARAWEIPVERDGTKKDIMPMLLAAERQGVFKHPPKHPEFARRAMRNSDEPPPEHYLPDSMVPIPVKKNDAKNDYRAMDIGELTKACQAKGIDTARRGGAWMIEQLEDSDAA